jgi:hypothetical protein
MISRRNRPLLIFLSLFLLVIALAGTSVYFYQRYHRLSGDSAESQKETEKLVAAVGQHLYLPEDEIPTVATVTDPERLRTQPFFVDAKLGYKVLIYTNAKKAVLYDPAADKIVNVAPISIGTDTPGTSTE